MKIKLILSTAIIIIITLVLITCRKEPNFWLTETINYSTDSLKVTLNGEIVIEGTDNAAEYGFCYNTSGAKPSITDNLLINGIADGLKKYSNTLLAPSPGTYKFSSYVKTNITQYGEIISFTILPQIYLFNMPTSIDCDSTNLKLYVSTNVPITIKTDEPWAIPVINTLKVGIMQLLLINIENNLTQSERTNKITLTGVGIKKEFSFSQKQKTILPSLTTNEVTEKSYTTATSGGNITSDGGAAVTARGVCWAITNNPTINDKKTSNGSGKGTWVSELIDLNPNTNYYIRAYAINTKGIAYGNEVSFTTTAQTTPDPPTNVSATAGNTQAIVYFTAPVNNGGSTIKSYTVTSNPGDITTKGTASPITVSGLANGTSYTFTITANNDIGSSAASVASNSVIPSIDIVVTDIDNNTYNTVIIGTQLWMKENLKTTKYNNGDVISTTTLDISNFSTTKYQWAYNGNISNVATYGRLYTWDAITDTRKICPTGWHIPTDAEWKTLSTYLGGDSVAGSKLKEQGTSLWVSPNSDADNRSGFTALPGGNRNPNGDFVNVGYLGYWWSATESIVAPSEGWYIDMRYNSKYLSRWDNSKKYGFSVRCLRD